MAAFCERPAGFVTPSYYCQHFLFHAFYWRRQKDILRYTELQNRTKWDHTDMEIGAISFSVFTGSLRLLLAVNGQHCHFSSVDEVMQQF